MFTFYLYLYFTNKKCEINYQINKTLRLTLLTITYFHLNYNRLIMHIYIYIYIQLKQFVCFNLYDIVTETRPIKINSSPFQDVNRHKNPDL